MSAGAGFWLSAGVCLVWFVGKCKMADDDNLCLPSPCGQNTKCDVSYGKAVCSCLPGYRGDPLSFCQPSKCQDNSDCPASKACRDFSCVDDVCAGACGVNSDCRVIRHVPVCSCPPGYEGDPFEKCIRIDPRPDDSDTNPEITSQEHETADVTTGDTAVPLPTISPTGCVLPKASSYRKFCSLAAGCEDCDIFNGRCFIPAGSMVDKVRVVCAPGYTLQTPYSGDIAVCLTNRWYPSIPECLKLCRPLVSEQLLLHCQLGTYRVDCSMPAQPNTTVTFKCLPSFSEYPDLKSHGVYRATITCRQSGEWSENLPLCKPGCGVSKEVQTFSPTIFNGTQAHIGFFPWHAGLYYPSENDGKVIWEQRCGGSLINDWVVLTAAHCVANVHESGLRIALGKYYRSWDTYEPTEEKRNVSEIIRPPQYTSSTYTFDIALVLLEDKIKLGQYIMPVCLNFDEGKNEIWNSSLYVVGWGKTDVDAQASEKLLYNTVKAMTDDECRQAIPTFYTSFEKICALKNNSGGEEILMDTQKSVFKSSAGLLRLKKLCEK